MNEPPTTLSVAIRVCRWADAQQCDPLDEQLVPGASETERARLRALGSLVGALASPGRETWPAEVQAWAGHTCKPPEELVAVVAEAMRSDGDVLAAIYERAVTPRNRRRLGTFFTSPELVEHMLNTGERLAGAPPDVVVDPGAGVGAFSLAAARRWANARIIAVDINVVTLGLLAARLDHEGLSARAELVLGDFVAWLGARSRQPGSVCLTLGNPPFTRSQSLEVEAKRQAAEAAGDMVASGHATLSTLFAAAVAQQLEPQDAMALVLPAAWTYTRSARELRAGLWNQRQRCMELHSWPTSARAFTGPSVTATVIGLGSQHTTPQPFVHGVASVVDGRVIVSGHQSDARQGPCPDQLPGGAGRRISCPPERTVALSEIFRPRRGVATGANSFFFLTAEQAAELPVGATRPGLCTLRSTPMENVKLDRQAWTALGDQGARCYLLDLDEALAEVPAVAALLATGRTQGVPDRYLCRQREPWYRLEHMEVPDVVLSPLVTAQGLRAASNEVGAIPSNSLYGLFLQNGIEDAVGSRVLDWLLGDDGVAALRGHGRQFAGGSIKLEPRELRTLPVPLDVVMASVEAAPQDTNELAFEPVAA